MTKIILTLAVAFLAVGAIPQPARAADVSVDLFYEGLQPYGDWIETNDYGYVWHPRDTAENWRPYTVGSWAYTDSGWTWVSDEPFGWATYHYGRWADLDQVGWVWVPEKEWAPAWVSWRTSDQYAGWAPLPPEARFNETVGIQGWADTYYDIGPSAYSFVEVRNLGAPALASVIVAPSRNVTIITETRNITNISYNKSAVFVEGPRYDVVSRVSAQPIRRLTLERQADIAYRPGQLRGEALRSTVQGNTLRVAAPRVNMTAQAAPAKVTRRLDSVKVNRGWQGVAQADQLRAQFQKSAPQRPAALPAQPKFERTNATAAGARGTTETPGATARGMERNANGTPSSANTTTATEPAKATTERRGTTSPTAAAPGGNATTEATTPRGEGAKSPNPQTPGPNNGRMVEGERRGKAEPTATTPEGRTGEPATESPNPRTRGEKPPNAKPQAKENDNNTKARAGETRTEPSASSEPSTKPGGRNEPAAATEPPRGPNTATEHPQSAKQPARPERSEAAPSERGNAHPAPQTGTEPAHQPKAEKQPPAAERQPARNEHAAPASERENAHAPQASAEPKGERAPKGPEAAAAPRGAAAAEHGGNRPAAPAAAADAAHGAPKKGEKGEKAPGEAEQR